MPVIAAALVTKAGRILLSRQFLDVSRIRIEGLLSAFPKLVGTAGARQATYIDSGTVRYVYQHAEQMYLVLVTTKGGNIMEDLSTLRLIGRLLPEYCPNGVDEEAVRQRCFPIMFAMDEVVTNSGQREATSIDQVLAALEMHSTEEERWKEEEARKKEEARRLAKEKAKELKAKKMDFDSASPVAAAAASARRWKAVAQRATRARTARRR